MPTLGPEVPLKNIYVIWRVLTLGQDTRRICTNLNSQLAFPAETCPIVPAVEEAL